MTDDDTSTVEVLCRVEALLEQLVKIMASIDRKTKEPK